MPVMSGESSKRSNIVDVTYSELHSIILGHREGFLKDQITEIIRPRIDQLKNISNPFGKPSDASRKQLDSGSVTLADGVILRVDEVDRTAAIAISDRFETDQIQALVLFRAFIYNEGLPADALSDSNTSFSEQLISTITPFYLSERLHIFRTLIPLFRADANESDFAHEFSQIFLPTICPDKGRTFVKSLIAEYQRKTQAALPSYTHGDPRTGTLWAKQNAKEQLVLLEVLFWAMWSRVTCDGPAVMRIFETAYETKLGHVQQNSSYLLDQEGSQLQQDCAAMWILITVEVLELETVTDKVDILATPDDFSIYTAYPESLKKIHELVTSHGDSQYACTYLAWTFVLSRLQTTANQVNELPTNYLSFFASVTQTSRGSFAKDTLPLHDLMSRTCLEPEAGLLMFMRSMLTESSVFVTGVALRTGSTITDPNNVAFRSVFKGLVMSLVELVPVEMIPEFELFVEVWIALFGRSESSAVEGICQQFWEHDSLNGISRRAIFDATRTRFPIQPRHLLRLLRAMTAAGFLDTDPLSIVDHVCEGQPTSDLRQACTARVHSYLDNLSTFTQVIPVNLCSGAHAVYEKISERSNSSYSIAFMNTRPIKLPGGSVLPSRSRGRVISGDTAEFMVVSWQHHHSGWKVVLEVLTDYARRRCTYYETNDSSPGTHSSRRGGEQPVTLRLQDIGVELDSSGDDSLVTDILDLIRSVIHDSPVNARTLLASLESGDSVVCHTTSEAPPDLVQLTTMILEEALSRSSQPRSSTRTKLITSALSVLASLLSLSEYSLRVWLYIRSTSALFGTDRAIGFVSSVLASERAIGHYTMTLSLLHLVQQLFNQASSTLLADEPKALQVKEEVLLRAARFIHVEIWVEHTGWKYVQLGDRFEIGRRVTSLYCDVLMHSPPNVKDRPFATLSQAVVEALLYKASMSTIHPLVSSLTTAGSVIGTLYASRRHGDARRLIYLLESHLKLTRMVLNCKEKSPLASKSCLLEQALCGKVTGGAASVAIGRSKLDPIDVLASYVNERRFGLVVPVEAMRVLYALCASLSTLQPSPPTIIGHLSNPEATVLALARIVQHPYDELALRITVWNFISLAVDREPALAGLFVTGHFQTPSLKGRGKETESDGDNKEPTTSKAMSAVEIAIAMLEGWKELWDSNAKLLACVLNFLVIVWEHGLEHRTALGPLRRDSKFWGCLASCAREELGPLPYYVTQAYVVGEDGYRRSELHNAVSNHAYRTVAKSHALHIIGLDISIFAQKDSSLSSVKPTSYLAIESIFNSEEELADSVLEATATPYEPALYDDVLEEIRSCIPALTLEQLQIHDPTVERELGDNFCFSRQLLSSRVRLNDVEAESLDMKLTSINQNLSLAHAQTSLTESWQHLLLQVVPYLRSNSTTRTYILTLVASISADVSTERRSGDMMATIHGKRLSLLLSLLEVAWFSTSDTKPEVEQFISLVKNIHGIIINETLSPVKSFLGQVTVPFHRTLLQIIYFCTKQCRGLTRRAKVLTAEQRLTITAMLEAALNLVIDALRMVFESARTRLDIDLDQDLELLVAVFEQCTRPDMNSSSVLWLTRCQDTNVIRASLELFAHTDLIGLSDIALLRARRQPLYAPHVLAFHMALASIPSAAERLASEGVLMAYSDNSISSAIRSGTIDVSIPELPGERSPAHKAYCAMLAIISGIATALGPKNHFFDAEASEFVQLYGDQISRALSWSIGDPLTLPYLEELEQVINIFHAISRNLPLLSKPSENVTRVLRVFTTHALSLVQQLNYALTHPNHLASLLEPVTAEERILIEKDRSSTFQSSSEIIDPMKRPFLTKLIHRMFRLTSGILSTLTDVSGAEKVLTGEQDEWPLHEAVVAPHSKVVFGEPASMGTLLELGNCTLDILRLLIDRPPGQAITPASGRVAMGSYEKPLDVRDAVSATRQNLEVVSVYAVTQLAMWLSKPEFDATSATMVNEMEVDDQASDHPKGSDTIGGTDRRGKRRVSSVSLADRLRRGMTGEMASDLQLLLTKAKSAIAKSQVILGTDSVDISEVLCHFLQERILAP